MRWVISRGIYDPEWLGELTKKVYPDASAFFGTTPTRVERAIRHAIENAWARHGDSEIMEEIFKETIDCNRGRPTNGEFLCTVSDFLRFATSSK